MPRPEVYTVTCPNDFVVKSKDVNKILFRPTRQVS